MNDIPDRPASQGVRNRLAEHRRKRGFSVAELARLIGISRQTVYAIESGSYVPNTAVALRLAQALQMPVEDLFALEASAPTAPLPLETVKVLPHPEALSPGEPVQLCRVDRSLVASLASPAPWYLPTADGVLREASRHSEKMLRQASAQLFHPNSGFSNRLLIAGCDPGITVLARQMFRAGIELVVAQRNSSQALELLKQGAIHVAGTHLRDESSGESNLPVIQRVFRGKSVAVISLAVWEEGLVVVRGNPKSIRAMADLARPDISIVNREPGAGSRLLLDSQLHRLGIDSHRVRGYDRFAGGHLPAAWQVRAGVADCCIATRAAARAFSLDFIPLVTERYDLAIRRRHLDHPPVQALLDALNRAGFRRELEGLGGYDASAAGRRLL